MITDGTTTEDLIATFGNARPLDRSSFEQGCAVLEAIAMFDARCGGGKLGTWREVSSRASLALAFMPATDYYDDERSHDRAVEQLARDVLGWQCRNREHEGKTIQVWVVVDKATRVTWAEISFATEPGPRHPRSYGEFASAQAGYVEAYAFARVGEPWSDTKSTVSEAYHEAKGKLDGEA